MARRAVNAFQTGLQTAGHNISNAKTEGYSRQRINLATTKPYTDPGISSPNSPGQVGTGVMISEITRVRDAFLDFQMRQEMSPLGYWSQIKRAYNTIETYVAEPSKKGMAASLDDFWASLQELNKNPDSTPVRESVVQQAKTFGTLLNQFVTSMDKFADQVNGDVKYNVDEVNTMLTKIAALNKTIAQVEASGQNPNDLYDERDLLVDKLSQKADITVKPPCAANDEYIISLNGKNLVQGDRVRNLVAHKFQWDGKDYYNVQVEDNEFDIVDDCSVADVLPGGPDGAHQLEIDRLASESAWKMGGANSFCLDENGKIVKNPSGDDVLMRILTRSPNDPINVTGSFRMQVGNSGVLARSANLAGRPGNVPPDGQILGAGSINDSYTFRVAAGGFERNITVAWNAASNQWDIKDDIGNTTLSVGNTLDMSDVSDFLKTTLPKTGNESFSIEESAHPAGTPLSQFGIKSEENWLVSIMDVKGDLAYKMGLSNDSREGASPVMTIDIEPEDSLQTICNKINEKFSTSDKLTEADQWVHAVIAYDANENAYITLESNVIGEGNRINILGDEDGNMQVLRRLGFVDTVQYGRDPVTNEPIYREVTSIMEQAKDASFTFDGRDYLSDTNMLKEARRVPIGNDYSAAKMEEVSLGLRLKLKSVGQTGILVLNHVRDGELRALQDTRDKVIPQFQDTFDEMIYNLVNELNALQYSGYGIGENSNMTGTGFFSPVGGKYGAGKRFLVNPDIAKDISLIGAASGNGAGKTNGVGDGSNALLMAQLKHAKVLNNKSSDFNAYYEGFLTSLGAQSGEARLMDKNQTYLTTSIEKQRQSVMGVNVDEEMLDIMQYTQSFNAIARYMNSVDEMLDKLINGFGLVGR